MSNYLWRFLSEMFLSGELRHFVVLLLQTDLVSVLF